MAQDLQGCDFKSASEEKTRDILMYLLDLTSYKGLSPSLSLSCLVSLQGQRKAIESLQRNKIYLKAKS